MRKKLITYSRLFGLPSFPSFFSSETPNLLLSKAILAVTRFFSPYSSHPLNSTLPFFSSFFSLPPTRRSLYRRSFFSPPPNLTSLFFSPPPPRPSLYHRFALLSAADSRISILLSTAASYFSLPGILASPFSLVTVFFVLGYWLSFSVSLYLVDSLSGNVCQFYNWDPELTPLVRSEFNAHATKLYSDHLYAWKQKYLKGKKPKNINLDVFDALKPYWDKLETQATSATNSKYRRSERDGMGMSTHNVGAQTIEAREEEMLLISLILLFARRSRPQGAGVCGQREEYRGGEDDTSHTRRLGPERISTKWLLRMLLSAKTARTVWENSLMILSAKLLLAIHPTLALSKK
ncbi:unnamed protein product [Microthlaspi erraticum]|uniref:Uncharacterized protein n=1 Tax=Microthlaspi erraticum TaxID=1685480 RepID=A0A6D2IRC7_9BRAS|nr:unnamed protein product [Microthlaspi erraticum]CAA7029669.1 unnamed protein product [Microthlaspi erraticum]